MGYSVPSKDRMPRGRLIVSMQPQVSGKVGSLVGFWVDHVQHSR